MDRYVATTDLTVGWAKAHGVGLLPDTVTAETIERNGWGESVKKFTVNEKDDADAVNEKAAAALKGADVPDPMAGGAPMAGEPARKSG